MTFNFTKHTSKEEVFKKIEQYLTSFVHLRNIDISRPWGGFFVVDEDDADIFISEFFPHLSREVLAISGKLSPKILIVSPGKRLSWQYHHRRAEIWKVIDGQVNVITSENDFPSAEKHLLPGDIIELKKGERHRIHGLDDWGVIAEIWRHTDTENPSDEDDIVRIEDDFGR
jgi:mannose-6-phosphate isomerase-like protein (cupin superfamily)